MACGTGKTLTALRAAEALVGAGGRVLCLVPSLALMSQLVRDWHNDKKIGLRSFAVCSDAQVGRDKKGSGTEDITILDLGVAGDHGCAIDCQKGEGGGCASLDRGVCDLSFIPGD